MGVIGLQLGLNAKNDRGVELAERMRKLPDFAQLPSHGRQRAFLTLGWGAVRKGDAQQARALFQEGLDIDATTPEAVTLKQELAKLK